MLIENIGKQRISGVVLINVKNTFIVYRLVLSEEGSDIFPGFYEKRVV